MTDLPLQTIRYLIGPVANARKMRITVIKNFLGFIMSVKESKKPVVRQLYNLTKDDVWTNGANLRKILLLPNKLSVDDLYPDLVNSIQYQKIKENTPGEGTDGSQEMRHEFTR